MKIALFGATGKMGRAITKNAHEAEIFPFSPSSVDDYISMANHLEADVAIDVSSPDAIELHISTCMNRSIPLVIGTTGFGPDHYDTINEAAKEIPIFQASNFSIGIALLKSMLKNLSRYSGDAFIDIIEKHAACKEDSPSGTALELAQLFTDKKVHPTQCPRNPEDLHIHSIRSNGYTFDHDVRFSFGAEELTLSHTVFNREVFAKGALQAAAFLKDQPPGRYNMEDLVSSIEVTQ